MTQLVLVYYTHLYPLAWALLFLCFESLWPVAQVCWQDHRHRRKKALPLKMFQKWHANGANSQNHSKIWSNTRRADDGVRILSGGGHEGTCHFIWQELIKVSVPRMSFKDCEDDDDDVLHFWQSCPFWQLSCSRSMHTNMKSLLFIFVRLNVYQTSKIHIEL